MGGDNLFTMLSRYRPGTAASPFDAYCAQGLAYILARGQERLAALLARRVGCEGAGIRSVDVQAPLMGAGFADLLVTFEGGQRVVLDVRADLTATSDHQQRLEEGLRDVERRPAFLRLVLPGDEAGSSWPALSWLEVLECLDEDADPLTRQYADFIRRDILGLGEVTLDDAITTNRLYALGAAALRRFFNNHVRYQNSASRPLKGRYRYLGTTFAIGKGGMDYWIGLVNEAVPLSEHYHLMLASRRARVREAVDQPRATGDWKWSYWTGLGRVVRPITAEAYEELLARILI